MVERLLDIKKLNIKDNQIKTNIQFENILKRDIAIIGMSGRFGSSEGIEEFWEDLKAGKEYIAPLSDTRKKDCDNYINISSQIGVAAKDDFKYFSAGFMNRVDNFDCSMFNISPKEANLMDPHQRLLLEVIYEAVEDSGYGGKKLTGSRTGVFVGHSNDFGEEYKRYCRTVSDTVDEAATTGNIRSIIGSRISYILDLKGPSITVDTACSSTLVAVHLACQAIRNGDCDAAIVGAAKVHIVPASYQISQGNIGILSREERARTFDDDSDGTGLGEGVGSVILKSLSKAVEDGDHIYAVIKGSAVNQDGSSVGITAPNMAAQEDVLLRAWKDANIDPETVAYIETHGTGTKLGDPIEITAIKNAFEHYTNKKQFCAVSSVKPNVGHLDNASGIVSLIKAVCAVKNGELPPTINFEKPNRKIAFEDSPVYVNDRLSKWSNADFPRRCGISSFGLSGTNCHIVLEEYKNSKKTENENKNSTNHYIFTLSAKNRESLKRLIGKYNDYLNKNNADDTESICYTANSGRGHYNLRIACLVKNNLDLKEKLKIIYDSNFEDLNKSEIYFGEHKVVSDSKQVKALNDITDSDKKQINFEAANVIESVLSDKIADTYQNELEKLCGLYVKGAEIEWEKLYQSKKHAKVSLPVYQFLKERHWVSFDKEVGNLNTIKNSNMKHPLFDNCIAQSMGCDIYSTMFSVEKHWVLLEHKVNGSYVIPGTTYIEMIREIASRYSNDTIELKDVMFITPLIAKEGEEVETHTIIREKDDYREFIITSKSNADGSWIKHVEGKFYYTTEQVPEKYNLDELKKKFSNIRDVEYGESLGRGVQTGPRFKNLVRLYQAEDEVLSYFVLPEEYVEDLEFYLIHPALLDSAANLANGTVGEGLYLPLSYKDMKIFGKMPRKFYSYMTAKNKNKSSKEIGVFNLNLMDENGLVFAVIDDYTVKKVHEQEMKMIKNKSDDLNFFDIGWIEHPLEKQVNVVSSGNILIFKNSDDTSERIINNLQDKGFSIYTVEFGNEFKKIDDYKYSISNNEDGYNKLFTYLNQKFAYIIHLGAFSNSSDINSIDELNSAMNRGVYSLFYLTKALVGTKTKSVELMLISDFAYNVTKNEALINPHNAAFLALGKVISKEYSDIKCKCIDIDATSVSENVIDEILANNNTNFVAYRNGIRYIEELREVDTNLLDTQKVEIKSEGVYVITGGAGSLGLEFSKHLAADKNVNLCLINRTPLPERNMWDSIIEKNENSRLCKKIKYIKEIEQSGSAVLLYSADTSDIEEMNQIFSDIRNKFGRINGVIHAAGIAGDGFIIRKDENVFKEVITPKTVGTWALNKVTENDNLDFFAMFSSISSILASPGQGDYTAANTYLDSFTEFLNKKGKRGLTINWPAWKETGMAVDHDAVSEESAFKPILTERALKAFEQLVNSKIIRAIPMELNYKILSMAELPLAVSPEIRHILDKYKNISNQTHVAQKDDTSHVNVMLNGKIGEEYTETENEIAKIWAVVLSINEVDIFDNFSDLGGDSILSTRLLKELQKKYDNLVDISDVFTYPTVKEMAEYIDKKTNRKKEIKNIQEIEVDNEDDSELDDLLSKIANGEVSIEEAEKLLDTED